MDTRKKSKLSVGLLCLLIGFPQISESIFTPILPALSKALKVTDSNIQLTVSIYFIGFALGVLIWGILSDKYGRKPIMLIGILIYLLGNISLLYSNSFCLIMMSRFIQAFGASVGSVITQAILRESYSGSKATKVFATVGAVISIAPAIGPIIGAQLVTHFHYMSVFLFLIVLATVLLILTSVKLPETNLVKVDYSVKELVTVAFKLLKDKFVLLNAFAIAVFNAILFNFYSEAPFIFINNLKLSTSAYGNTGILIALGTITGAYVVNKLAVKTSSFNVILLGICIAVACSIFSIWAFASANIFMIYIAIFGIFLGINIALPVILKTSLYAYEEVIGIASGIFGLMYYCMIGILTFIMSVIHTGNILVFPIYTLTLVIALFILIFVNKSSFKNV